MRAKAYNKMVDAHVAEIERVFGAEAAQAANIGWGSGDLSICSKVYGEKGGYCQTYHDKQGNVEYHESWDWDQNPLGEDECDDE